MDRLIVISADTHAGARPEQFTQYLDSPYRPAYEEALRNGSADTARRGFDTAFEDGGNVHSRAAVKEYHAFEGIDPDIGGGTAGQWDSAVRAKQLEATGVVAEVIFPNASPFMVLGFPEPGRERELVVAGMHAYNRWLADFCAELPDRRAGLAMVDTYDVPGAVATTEWAAKVGLRGIMVPYGNEVKDMPLFDSRLEPLWAAAESTGMVAHVHGGAQPSYKIDDRMLAMKIFISEGLDITRQQLAHMIWSGVLERHPKLKFVTTEATTGWAAGTLKWLDQAYHSHLMSYLRSDLPLAPSEYFHRQCYIGASSLSPEECDLRYEIGVKNIMFGDDYPHLEGTYPHTVKWMQCSMGGIPEAELRQIAGENAAEVYGFDLDVLRPIAERVGPKVADFTTRARGRNEEFRGLLR